MPAGVKPQQADKKYNLSDHLFTKRDNLKVLESVQPERIFHIQGLM